MTNRSSSRRHCFVGRTKPTKKGRLRANKVKARVRTAERHAAAAEFVAEARANLG